MKASKFTNTEILAYVLAILIGGVACACGSRLHVSRRATISMSPAPTPGTARVVFLRPRGASGHHAVSVWDDGRLVAFVRTRQRTHVDLAPGLHTFLGVMSNADVLEAELAAGRTYYVHVRTVSYYVGQSVFLDPVYPGHENWPLVQDWINQTTPVELIPSDAAEWTRRHAAGNEKRMRRYASRPPAERKYMTQDQGI